MNSSSNNPQQQHPIVQNKKTDMSGASTKVPARSDKKAPGAFRTISEVAELLDVQQHVLRFWETKFSQVKPLKRGGGRRYYRPEDIELLTTIHHLLYTEGYTIKGVQKMLREQGKNSVIQNNHPEVDQPAAQPISSQEKPAPSQAQATPEAVQAAPSVQAGLTQGQKDRLQSLLAELKSLRGIVES